MDDFVRASGRVRSCRADYEVAVPGKIKMIPHQALEQALRDDYKKFESMIYGTPPSFDDVLSEIEKVENLVNNQA